MVDFEFNPTERSEAVNTYCPRSGKQVQSNSLATYRGFTVGFCNTECRDDFSANPEKCKDDRRYFDILINELDLEND